MRNSYTALAEAYDALMYDVDADAWAAYLDMLLGGAPKRMFEAACGTGNITLGLLEKGYDVTACDISEEMVERAARKAAEKQLGGCFMCMDMTQMFAFEMDAVVAACDGVNYLAEDGEAEACFQAAYRSLKSGGRLLFDVSSEYKLREIVGNEMFYDDGDDVTFFWQNETVGNRVTMSLTLFFREGALYRRGDEEHVQRIYTEQELRKMLADAGFEKVLVYGFGGRERPGEKEERLQFVAVKG